MWPANMVSLLISPGTKNGCMIFSECWPRVVLKHCQVCVISLQRCRNKGLKLAVATSADYVKMMINLRETGLARETFDVLINGQEVIT